MGGSTAARSVRQPQAGDAPLLEVEDLRTVFHTDDGVVHAVDGVSFTVRPGDTLGIVGESGSGKTVTALSIMRLLTDPARIAGGSVRFRGRDVLAMNQRELSDLRGGQIAMIFQDPMTSLNPVMRISSQLEEAMLVHGRFTERGARTRAVDLLAQMGISAPASAVRNFPHQFSGGMRQRVMLAMGLSNEPSLIIADEPTTALDVTIQAQILDLLRRLNEEFGVAIILISHDLGVVANVCPRVLVMYAGQIVEDGPTEQLLQDPKHPYTWALINAVPRLDRAGQRRLTALEGMPPDLVHPPSACRFAPRCPFRVERSDKEAPPLVEVAPGRRAACWVTQAGTALPRLEEGLGLVAAGSVSPSDSGAPLEVPVELRPRSEVHVIPLETTGSAWEADERGPQRGPTAPRAAVATLLELRGVVKHFPVARGWLERGAREVVHAVNGVDLAISKGETLGLVGESGSGKSTLARLIVRLYEPTAGEIRFEGRDIAQLNDAEMRPIRRRMQMIFQDPYSSLNGRMRVGQIIAEPLRVHGLTHGRAPTTARVQRLLGLVGLPARAADRFPHEFSGGQRQRIGIARALALEPTFIVADEPISSLDVNIQAQVINLLEDLQDELGITYLFIAHDLSIVRHVSDRIAVLYLGKVMEVATNEDLYARPLNPYTVSLISAALIPDAAAERTRRRIRLEGEIPSAIHPPSGCPFRTRCPLARDICAEVEPPLIEHRPGQWAACHFAGEPIPPAAPSLVEKQITTPVAV